MTEGKGRKPLPNVVHISNGNPSKLPMAKLRNGVSVPVEIPKPPAIVKGEAKKIWKRTAERLQRLGVINSIDESALTRYCLAYARYIEVEKEIDAENKAGLLEGEKHKGWITKTPSGYEQQSVLFQIRSKMHDELKSLEAVFGMTPSARSSVDISPQQKDLFNGDNSEEKQGAAKYF